MYTRTRRATYPQLQPPQQGGMMGFLQQAQDQYNAANKANEDRYQDILGRLEGRYDRNMERVGNWGQTAMADSRDRAAENMGAIQANLSARGLGNSSIVESYRQRNAADLDRNLGQISEMRDSRMAQYDQTLSKDIADFMERRYDNAPNIGQIAQLAQLYGAGGGSNIGYFGGGERTSGSGRGSRRAISNPAGRRQGSRPFNRDEAARQYERDVKQYLQQMLRTGSANMAGQPLPWGPNGTSYSDRRGLTFRYGQSPDDKQVREWIDRHGGNPYSTRPNDRREFMAGGVSPMAAMQMAAGMQGMMAPLQNAAFNIYNAGFNGYNPNTYGGYQPRYAEASLEPQSEGDAPLTPVQERVLREQAEKEQRIAERRFAAEQEAASQPYFERQAEAGTYGPLPQPGYSYDPNPLYGPQLPQGYTPATGDGDNGIPNLPMPQAAPQAQPTLPQTPAPERPAWTPAGQMPQSFSNVGAGLPSYMKDRWVDPKVAAMLKEYGYSPVDVNEWDRGRLLAYAGQLPNSPQWVRDAIGSGQYGYDGDKLHPDTGNPLVAINEAKAAQLGLDRNARERSDARRFVEGSNQGWNFERDMNATLQPDMLPVYQNEIEMQQPALAYYQRVEDNLRTAMNNPSAKNMSKLRSSLDQMRNRYGELSEAKKQGLDNYWNSVLAGKHGTNAQQRGASNDWNEQLASAGHEVKKNFNQFYGRDLPNDLARLKAWTERTGQYLDQNIEPAAVQAFGAVNTARNYVGNVLSDAGQAIGHAAGAPGRAVRGAIHNRNKRKQNREVARAEAYPLQYRFQDPSTDYDAFLQEMETWLRNGVNTYPPPNPAWRER